MIRTQQHDTIFEIILNRPGKHNAVQLTMLRDLATAVLEAQKLQGIRLIVIRGEGANFSTGLDLNAMGGIPEEFGDNWQQRPHAVTAAWQGPVNTLATSPIPTLALIQGYCLGAGLEIALACDFRYGTPDAQLGLAETRVGLIPDVGGTTRLIQVVGAARARELIYTARRIDGEAAARYGLLNRIVAEDALEETAQTLAEELSQCAPLAIAAAKRVIQGIVDDHRGLYLEALEQAPLFRTQDLQEGIQSILERRSPNWSGK
jgi:enoyl-CoA hydratase/carnithine racemase